MDKNKIAFIICTNDMDRCSDCISYIERLNVPDKMSMNIITVQSESGICSAYNKAMRSCDAAYKVYLHHDTYIINKDFINGMTDCFERHPKAGMLGMIGRKSFKNHERFYQNEAFGELYETRLFNTVRYSNYSGNADEKVLYLDGLLMMSRTDIPWREDIFDKWHLYDVSQSLEMYLAGFEIYVPYMTSPWALHDCGLLSIGDYAEEKEKAVREYREIIEKFREPHRN